MPRAAAAVKHPKPAVLPIGSKAELLESFKDFPAINLVERRLQNPNDPGSLPILLKDESVDACVNSDHQRLVTPKMTKCAKCRKPVRKWHVHWTNTGNEGRWAQIKTKAYVPVLIKELHDQEDVADLVKSVEENGDTWVRRGDRGKEILMKQPLPIYNHIQADKQRTRDASFKSKKQLQAELAEAAGKEHGDEAGEFVHHGGISVETLRTSRTSLGEEAGD